MKSYRFFLGVMIVGISVTGCATPHGQPDYTATGALAGGATGAVIGSTVTQHPAEGALVGAAVGAVAGGIVGHGMDQARDSQLQAPAPPSQWHQVEKIQPLTIADIKSMAKAKISSDVIISQILNSHTIFHLNSADIIDLKKARVSEKVIDFMINTPSTIHPAVPVAAGNPPQPLVEPVIVAPGPDYYWIGGGWVWFGDSWIWHHGYWHEPMYRGGYGHEGYGHEGFGHGGFGHEGFGHEGFGRH